METKKQKELLLSLTKEQLKSILGGTSCGANSSIDSKLCLSACDPGCMTGYLMPPGGVCKTQTQEH